MGGRFDAAFGGDLQRTVECELNLAGCLFASFAVRHDAGPFDDLGDKAFVTFLRRIPNPDFVIARLGLHRCFHVPTPSNSTRRIVSAPPKRFWASRISKPARRPSLS